MTKAIFALLMIAILVLAGCIGPPTAEILAKATKHPVVSGFTASHPAAQPTVTPWSRAESESKLNVLRQACSPQAIAADYYYVSFRDGSDFVEAWLVQSTLAVACVHRSDDACVVGSDCAVFTADPCTKGICSGTPKGCSVETIAACVGGDGCCPSGCDYFSDLDCLPDLCQTDADCDDGIASTKDVCGGTPKECSNTEITDCEGGDNFCPEGCHAGNDSDCSIAECETDKDCDDGLANTEDECTGEPGVCSNTLITVCASGDGYCPEQCDDLTDRDCIAETGDRVRITVTCDGVSTEWDEVLRARNGQLKATFDAFVNHANNESLVHHKGKSSKYNDTATTTVDMSERISIGAIADYDKAIKKATLQIPRNELVYSLNLGEGIPTTELASNDKPFVAGSDDKMVIPFFGKDSVVRGIDQGKGEVELLTNMIWRDVDYGGIATGLEGKNGESYDMAISKCEPLNITFLLYEGDDFIKGMTGAVGSVLFGGKMEQLLTLTYLYQQTTTKYCKYDYALGDYIEKLTDGEMFPADVNSDWRVSLDFGEKRLKKIELKNDTYKWVDTPIKTGETITIIGEPNTFGENYCTLTFNGLVR